MTEDKKNPNSVTIISSVQSKMARAATGLGIRELAEISEVSPDTVARLERGEDVKASTREKIRVALERRGLQFIEKNGGGPGVRLKRN